MSTAEVVSNLSTFTSCEISDALIKLGLPHGGHIPDIHLLSSSSSSETRICGPAYTVQMRDPLSSLTPLHVQFVPLDYSATVHFFAFDPEVKSAVWGGLMTAGAQARSIIGVIISGRCRDLSEHRRAQFPVFARGHSTLGQSPFTRPSAVNIPLVINSRDELGGEGEFPAVKVEPGDWMVADEDGVVCIPRELWWKVVELAAKGKEVDSKCLEDIHAGKGVQVSFKKHRGT